MLSMRKVSLLLASLFLHAAAVSAVSHCEPNSDQGQCQASTAKKTENVMLQTRLTSSRIQENNSNDVAFVEQKDITFPVMWNGKKTSQVADIMHPSDSVPNGGWPALIIVHGLGNTKADYNGLAKKFMTLSPGRLCLVPEFTYGSRRLVDIKASIEFLSSDSKFNVNPDQITLFGYSLGGTIAAELILTDEWVYGTLQAAVVVAGTYGYHSSMAHHRVPPLLLVHCENDGTMPFKQSQKLYNTVAAFDQATDLKLETCDLGHNPMTDRPWFLALVDEFIKKQTPEPEVRCLPFCARSAKPFDVKVQWPDCNGCKCKAWCAKSAKPFEVKSGWPDCNGCTKD